MNIPVLLYNDQAASEAYARYSALRCAEKADPSLIDEECFQILLSDAYRSFETAFCAPTMEISE